MPSKKDESQAKGEPYQIKKSERRDYNLGIILPFLGSSRFRSSRIVQMKSLMELMVDNFSKPETIQEFLDEYHKCMQIRKPNERADEIDKLVVKFREFLKNTHGRRFSRTKKAAKLLIDNSNLRSFQKKTLYESFTLFIDSLRD